MISPIDIMSMSVVTMMKGMAAERERRASSDLNTVLRGAIAIRVIYLRHPRDDGSRGMKLSDDNNHRKDSIT